MAVKKLAAKPARTSVQAKTGQKSAVAKTRKGAAGHDDASKSMAGDEVVTIDRRHKGRREESAEAAPAPVAAQPALERRKKVQRRRQIDPTTCERDYSIEEVEFMNAMDDYKRTSGRMFPTCSEVLEVIRGLGYVKLSPAGVAMLGDGGDLSSAEELLDEAEDLLSDASL